MTLAIEYYEKGSMPTLFDETKYDGKERMVKAESLLTTNDQRYVKSTRGMMVAMQIPTLGERMVLLSRNVPESSVLVRDTKDNSVVTFPLAAGG